MITTVVGRYSGIVAYKDGSNGPFHAQVEYLAEELAWSIDQALTQLTTGRIVADQLFYQTFKELHEGFQWPNPVGDKALMDMIAHFHLRFTFDDGTQDFTEFLLERKAWRQIKGINNPAHLMESDNKLIRAIDTIFELLGAQRAA